MNIYILSYIFFSLNSFFFIKKNIFFSISFIISILFLILIFGFKHNIGGDWWVYEQNYNLISNKNSLFTNIISNGFNDEFGYFFFSSLIKGFGLPIHYLNFTLSIIFFLLFSSFLKILPNKFLGLVISFPVLIVIIHGGFIRQSIALALFAASINQYLEKKYIYFILLLIVAYTFHISIIIVIPIFILSRLLKVKKISFNFPNLKYFFFILFILSILLIAYYNKFLELFNTYILESDNPLNFEYPKGAIFRIGLNIMASIGIIYIYLGNILNKYDDKFYLFLSISIFSILSLPLFILFPVLIDRLNYYFIIVQVYFFSYLPYYFKSKINQKYIISLIILFYLIIFNVWMHYGIHSKYWDNYSNYLLN